MSIYTYAAPSTVDEVTFITTENGSTRAYLSARSGTDTAPLHALVQSMTDKNWLTVPFVHEGKPMLEVRGFNDEKILLKHLEFRKAVEGTPTIQKDEKVKSSLWDKAKKRSLQVSGAAYLVGDYNFIRYGWKSGSREDVIGGILYGLGTLSLIAFGRNDQSDLQIDEHGKALEKFLIKENVRIPQECTLHTMTEEQKGLMGQAYDWMRGHPAELFNTIYVGAGAMIAAAAIKHKVLPLYKGTTEYTHSKMASGLLDVGLGSLTATSALVGNLVKEKKRDPDEPLPEGAIQKAMAWVQEKPLRVTGYGMMVSTLCHAVSSTIDYRNAVRMNDIKGKSAIANRAIFVGANLIAEAMIALSSKGHGEGVLSDDSVQNTTLAIAADLIVQQPPEMRDELIHKMATFLQQPTMLAESYEKVEADLRNQIGLQEKNPWACCVYKAAHPEAQKGQATHHANAPIAIPSTVLHPATITAHNAQLGAPASY